MALVPGVDPLPQETTTKNILDLPIDIRDRILNYLLPTEETIDYRSPYRWVGLTSPLSTNPYRRCGGGESYFPGYTLCPDSISYMRKHKIRKRRLAIMRVNSVLYEDASRLLYNRVFLLRIGDSGPLFVNINLLNAYSFERFPLGKMKAIKLIIETSFHRKTLKSTIDTLHWVCRTLGRAECLRDLQVELCFTGALSLPDREPEDIRELWKPLRLLSNTSRAKLSLQMPTYKIPGMFVFSRSHGRPIALTTTEDQGGMPVLVNCMAGELLMLLRRARHTCHLQSN